MNMNYYESSKKKKRDALVYTDKQKNTKNVFLFKKKNSGLVQTTV